DYKTIQRDLGPIGPERNWKGIGISLLVIVAVLSLIGLSIVLLSKDDGGKPFGSQLTLDDLFQRNFQIHDPDAKWISGKSELFILRYRIHLLFFPQVTFKASKFAVSPDLNYILLGYDVKQIFQHSFLASYLIYNLYTREVRELNPPEVSDSVLQFASWGVQGQQLIYVFENNIYYQTDVQSSSWRLTSSGQEGVVFNGISDWLYEEEVLHTQVAHWWSPDSSRLAYLTINDSLVPNMLLPRLTGSLYPRGKEYPYPKMGQINPTVRLYVVTLDGSSLTTELTPPDSFEKSEYYITMVKWVARDRLSVRWVNRAQNTSILSLCDVTTGDCTKKHVMTSEKWLDRQNEEPVFSKDCTTFFITMPLGHGGRGTFNHITMISNQVNLRHLTSGSWEVSQILAYDESTNSLYFLSTEEGSTQRQFYRVSTLDPFHKECLTCLLFKSKCTSYDAIVSPDDQHVLLSCRGRHLVHCLKPSSHSDSAPGGQAVTDRFSLSWDSVLVSSDNVLVARLDGRGSGFQGQRILHEVHQRLGTVDVQDQIAALEHLVRLPYIDGNRVGVYGKAYGGFLSILLLLSHSSMFRCGIAVAPITNWRLHGIIDTAAGMNFSFHLSALFFSANVHFQHSAELVKLLSASNVNYTLQVTIFPDEGHNMASTKSQHYMLNSVLTFFKLCFEEEQVVVPEKSKEHD
uniref:Dipeptidyl-peptidase 10 (Non-functional) n=1 Tax=Cyclopterus lumpus TaxID=8103 RepID=A0A8C3AHJ8_CYCLU